MRNIPFPENQELALIKNAFPTSYFNGVVMAIDYPTEPNNLASMIKESWGVPLLLVRLMEYMAVSHRSAFTTIAHVEFSNSFVLTKVLPFVSKVRSLLRFAP